MWSGLVELVYPPRCAGCGEPGALFCATCQRGLVPLTPPLCARCGGPMAFTGPPSHASSRCLACLRHPPGFEVARSVAAYEGPIRAAIQALKYRRRRALAEPLGRLLAAGGAGDATPRATCVVPVPLHPSRLAARGFNQADLLARPVAVRLGLPYVPD
ncbi:MAG: double zinc ribbon domain-containing protein [Armatimonadota bacterium]|nr:double zinc ribbon domain-containing protein [Armatimonadota bacterium]